MHECVETVLGGTALQEMFVSHVDEVKFLAISEEFTLHERSDVKLSVLVKCKERELHSFPYLLIEEYIKSITANIIFLPRVLFVAGKDQPRDRHRGWDKITLGWSFKRHKVLM